LNYLFFIFEKLSYFGGLVVLTGKTLWLEGIAFT